MSVGNGMTPAPRLMGRGPLPVDAVETIIRGQEKILERLDSLHAEQAGLGVKVDHVADRLDGHGSRILSLEHDRAEMKASMRSHEFQDGRVHKVVMELRNRVESLEATKNRLMGYAIGAAMGGAALGAAGPKVLAILFGG